MVDLPQYGNVFPDDILARLRDLETAVNDLQDGTFAAVVTLAGDVTGDSSATVVGQLQGYPVSATAPASGEVLEWDGSAWTPTALGGGTGDVVQSNYNTLTNSPLTYTSLRGTTQAPTWRMERSSGTGASPTALAGGLTIGAFTFGGYTGSAWTSSAVAGLYAKTTQTFSGSAQGTYLTLETTPDNSTTRAEAFRVTGAGDLVAYRGFPSLRPENGPFGYRQRGASLFLARASTDIVTELYIGDSTCYLGSTDAESAELGGSCVSIYDGEMVARFNAADRTSGHMPVEHYVFGGHGVEWDTIQGTATARGPNYNNRRLTGSQYCQVARKGTAVTVFYTAQDSGGGVATVTINGEVQSHTLNSTDGTLAAGTYDSGRSYTYFINDFVPIDLKVQITSGTAFELEGAYFHNQNAANGYRLIRADKIGQSFSYLNDTTTSKPLLQVVANLQPNIVTIQLGHNDVSDTGAYELSADELADELTTMVGNIRGEYADWTPTIRFVFQQDSEHKPTDWLSTYQSAMRNACLDLDVEFVDLADVVGSVRNSDPYEFGDPGVDTVHPHDYGHWVWGKALADLTCRTSSGRKTIDTSTSYWQTIDAPLTILKLKGTTGPTVGLGRDNSTAVTTNQSIGGFNFSGAINSYGELKVAASVSGIAEGNFSSSAYKGGLRFSTSSTTTLSVRGGIDGDGMFFIGTSPASKTTWLDAAGGVSTVGTFTTTSTAADAISVNTNKFTVNGSSGNTVIAGTLSVTGHPTLEGVTATGATGTGALVYSTSPALVTPDLGAATFTSLSGPVLTLDNAFNTITQSLANFGAVAFGNAPTFVLRRAQGMSGFPSNITSGINLAQLSFAGYNSDGTYYTGAVVRGVSEEAWTTAAYRGSRLEFLTAPNASGTAVAVRALIDNAGNFYVGATAAAAKFSVTGSSGNTTVSGTLGVTGNTTLSGTLSVTGHPTLEGVTATGATGTGKLVFDTSPALVTPDLGAATATSLTASAAQAGAVASVTQGTVGNPVMQLVSTATNDDPTETVRQYRLTTGGASTQTLGSISLTASTTTVVQAVVVARRTGGTSGTPQDGAAYLLHAVFQGTVQIGTTQQTIIGRNQAGWDATLDYNTNAARVRVTGATSNDITWHATVRIWSVGT